MAGDNVTGTLILPASQFESLAATGTPPLIVASATVVADLNADLLDGKHASEFALAAHSHAWSDVSKVGSSLADLATRSASDLSSGTIPNARLAGAYTGITEVGTLVGLTVSKSTSGGIVSAFIFNAAASAPGNRARLSLGPQQGYIDPVIAPYLEAYDEGGNAGLALGTYGGGLAERVRITPSGVVLVGTTVATSAAAGELVLANNKTLRWLNAAGTATLPVLKLTASDAVELNLNSKPLTISGRASSATVSGGAAQALPAAPAAYLTISFDGSLFSIPVYNHVS